MIKKFELDLSSKITFLGIELFRIKALISFGDVEKGDFGGYVQKEENLSHFGNAWVYGNAKVYDNARVYGNAKVYDNAWVYDNARVYGNAKVYDNAWVYDNARVYGNAKVSGNARVSKLNDYIVFKNNWSSGRYFTYTRSNKMWSVGCFYGTGGELVKKAYQDSEDSGKHYEAYVNLVKTLEALDEN
jgi:hypothetical protein